MKNKFSAWTISFLTAFFLSAARPALAGWHLGEARDIVLDVIYSAYAYLAPGPVYYIGTEVVYQANLHNEGNRDFKDFQAKGLFVWAGNYNCAGGSYVAGQPLPGSPDSGWQPASMGKGGGASFSAVYPIPLTVCPGSVANLVVSYRRANSGQTDAGSFTIPSTFQFNKKK